MALYRRKTPNNFQMTRNISFTSHIFETMKIKTCKRDALSTNADISYPHDDVNKWKHFLRYWPFVRGIHRSPMNSPHKGQWRGALMFSLIWVWLNGWVNNREASDLRHYRAHYDVTVMSCPIGPLTGELWGVFCEDWVENLPRYNGTALYSTDLGFVSIYDTGGSPIYL